MLRNLLFALLIALAPGASAIACDRQLFVVAQPVAVVQPVAVPLFYSTGVVQTTVGFHSGLHVVARPIHANRVVVRNFGFGNRQTLIIRSR